MDQSPLGRLSPELRNSIYNLALYERRPVALSRAFWPGAALLRTCKQIREEAQLLFYAINDFTAAVDIGPWVQLDRWVESGPPQKLALIRSLTIRIEIPGYKFLNTNPNGVTVIVDEAKAPRSHLEGIFDIVRRTSFGKRDVEGVVRFVFNGAPDNVPFADPSNFSNVGYRTHAMAELFMMYVVFGKTATNEAMMKFPEEQGFYEMEKAMHKRMQARLQDGGSS